MLTKIGRDNLLIMLSLLVWALGEGLWTNLRQILLTNLGATPQQVGLALGVESVGRMVLLIPGGYLIDRIGPRAIMIAGWVVGIAGVLVMVAATTWPSLAVGLAIYASTVFVVPAFSAYALMSAPEGSDAQRTLSVVYASFPLGLVVSPGLGGWIAERAGSIRVLLWIAMGLYVISTAILLFARHVNPRPRQEKFHIAHLPRYRAFAGYSLYFAVTLAVLLVSFALIPNFLQESRGFSIETIGVLFSALALGSAALNLLLGRVGRRWSFPLALGIFWAAALIVWQVRAPFGIGAGFFLLGVIYCLRPTVLARLETVIRPEDRGMAYSIIEFLFGGATVVASVTAGQLYALTAQHDLPLITALAATPAAAAMWFGLRLGRIPQRETVEAAPIAPAGSGES